jgi:hypothetical protein
MTDLNIPNMDSEELHYQVDQLFAKYFRFNGKEMSRSEILFFEDIRSFVMIHFDKLMASRACEVKRRGK